MTYASITSFFTNLVQLDPPDPQGIRIYLANGHHIRLRESDIDMEDDAQSWIPSVKIECKQKGGCSLFCDRYTPETWDWQTEIEKIIWMVIVRRHFVTRWGADRPRFDEHLKIMEGLISAFKLVGKSFRSVPLYPELKAAKYVRFEKYQDKFREYLFTADYQFLNDTKFLDTFRSDLLLFFEFLGLHGYYFNLCNYSDNPIDDNYR